MDDLDETVLSIQQRQKRAQIMRRNKSKIERAREIAKKKMAPEANIRKRAFAQARQLIRRRVAGARGAEYEKLGPSEKIAIDRAVEGKQKAIKKLALRLIPRVKQAEAKRLHTFMKGQQIQNHGQPEGNSKETSGSSSVKESLNTLFNEAFPPGDISNVMGQRVDNPVTSSTKKMPPKGKSKNDVIIQYNKFNEEVENDTSAFTSLLKKSEKSGIDLEVLGEVYNRGWNTWTEDCKVSQQQYAFARVNSYINQGKTYFNEDADLHEGHDKNHPIVKEYNVLKKHDIKTLRSMIAQKGGVVDTSGFRSKDQAASHLIRTKHGNKKVDQAFGFNEEADLDEARAPGRAYVAPFNDEQGNQRGWKSSNKWGKVKYWQPHAKKSAMKHAGLQEEEVQQTNENFIDGKGPGKPGDSARHGLKGKSASELRKIRSSETASPRKKQLAHWMLNMHHNEEVTLKEGIGSADPDYHAKVHQDLQWHASRNRGNSMGAANYHHLMSLDDPSHIEKYYEKTVYPILKKHNYPTPPVGPGDGGNPKYHAAVQEIIKNWKNEPRWMHNEETELDEKRGLWDNIHAKRKRIKAGSGERMRKPGSEGAPTKQNFRDASESIEDTGNGTSLVDKESKNSKVRKKIEVVDRKPPFTGLTRQAEIQKKVIDEDHTKCSTPECCGQCDTAVVEKLGNTQNDSKKRLAGTDSLVKAYKADTPFSEDLDKAFNAIFNVKEETRTADVKGVIVRTADGKTIVRKQKVNHKIIGTGNLTDGKPDDTV